jgi:hypothetical protein
MKMAIFPNSHAFLTNRVPIGEKFLKLSSAILLIASLVSWRLVHAFIGKKEQAKEEKTFGQSWEIANFIFCAHPVLLSLT